MNSLTFKIGGWVFLLSALFGIYISITTWFIVDENLLEKITLATFVIASAHWITVITRGRKYLLKNLEKTQWTLNTATKKKFAFFSLYVGCLFSWYFILAFGVTYLLHQQADSTPERQVIEISVTRTTFGMYKNCIYLKDLSRINSSLCGFSRSYVTALSPGEAVTLGGHRSKFGFMVSEVFTANKSSNAHAYGAGS